jgi:hypothetical protein
MEALYQTELHPRGPSTVAATIVETDDRPWDGWMPER